MGLISKIKNFVTQLSTDDAALYAAIAEEVEQGYRREGLWAKALTEADFDESKAKAIYMRMAVKVLGQELRQQAIAEEKQNKLAMENAFTLFDQGRYEEAAQGLLLRLEQNNDHTAGACLGYMFWYGHGVEENKSLGLKLLEGAEQTTDASTRHFIGSLYEYIDWQKSLNNYNYAAQNGDPDAKSKAKALTKRLKSEGVIPKNFIERLFD